MGPSSAGGVGKYHYNIIERVRQPRADSGWGRLWVPLKLPLNNSTTIEIPLKWKGSSSRGRTLLPLKYQ